MKVSIIIVNYKVKQHVIECIQSIISNKPRFSYEILIVDNDEKKTLFKSLRRKFPTVKYVPNKNRGFGQANNVGATVAKGQYLFFLNPDTKITSRAIDNLVHFLDRNKRVGIVAPLLLDSNENAYELQGTEILTPGKAVFAYSFLNKFLPNNFISHKFWMKGWDKTKTREVEVVPGTAFMIRSEIYKRVGGFDEKLFLYFEEYDLCKRVKEIGYKILIVPAAKVIHFWGESTKKSKLNIDKIFNQSRFYYFKKHFGFLQAMLASFFLEIKPITIVLILFLCVALFLRTYRIYETMPFIGDQAWFYLSARDMLLTGKIPLVGPETSHPWIHHGPLWTYVLAFLLFIFKFDPVLPVFYIIVLGVITVWLIYKLGSQVFSKEIGIAAAALYATSPLIVINSRIPYHTSPIPFFSILLFLCLYNFITRNVYYFPVMVFLMAILYNHEFTSFVLFIPIFLVIIYGVFKKEKWMMKVFQKKVLIFSFLGGLIPMVPFIIYDIQNGYKQTAGFAVWVIYRIYKFITTLSFTRSGFEVADIFSLEVFIYIKRLIFAQNLTISLTLFVISYLYILVSAIKNRSKKGPNFIILLLLLYNTIPIVGLFLHRVPIEADVLLISPFIILMIAYLFGMIFSKDTFLKPVVIVTVLLIIGLNINYLIHFYWGTSSQYKKIIAASDRIIGLTEGRPYNLIGKGELDNFPVFTMPYEYILWYKGYPLEQKPVSLKIVVWQDRDEIKVYEKK